MRNIKISCSVSSDNPGTGSNDYVYMLAKNGTEIARCKRTIAASSGHGNCGIEAATDVSTNDIISLKLMNDTDNDDILVSEFNIIANLLT